MNFPNFPLIEGFQREGDEFGILFFTEDIEFELAEKEKLIVWILDTIRHENKEHTTISYIFCSDKYLHAINLDHLKHDDLTDIISFPYSKKQVEGDIFISIDRIKENALKFGVTFEDELHRVMIHGILHLIGYVDKKPKDKALMTEKENFYLAKL